MSDATFLKQCEIIGALETENAQHVNAISCLVEERDRLKARITVLEEALQFYASPWNRRDEHGDLIPIPDFYSELEFGERASTALTTKGESPGRHLPTEET